MANRPATVFEAFNNRRGGNGKRKDDSTDKYLTIIHGLEEKLSRLQLANMERDRLVKKMEQERVELEWNLKKLERENQKLVAKVVEILEEKQDLEGTLRRKDDLLRFKPRGKFSGFMVGMQDKLKNRPSIDAIKQTKIYKNEPCFDTDLDKVIMHETYTMVPKVLVECVKLLESRPMYMHHLGLYRASGNHADIQKLRFQIDANNYKTLYNQTDPHNITGIVKLFFRELKLPIVSLRQIDAVIPDDQFFIGMDEKLQIVDVHRLVNELPAINRATLKFFMEHIAKVASIEANHMNAYSLSIVVGACIFYETMQSTNTYLLPNRCAELMITHHREVFR